MKTNLIITDFQKEILEILFLFLLCLFSFISFWIGIPLGIFLIILCYNNTKKVNRKYLKYFYYVILSLTCISIFFSISVQFYIFNIIRHTQAPFNPELLLPGLLKKLTLFDF